MRYLDELFRLNKKDNLNLRFKFEHGVKKRVFTFDTRGEALNSQFLVSVFDITNTFFSKYNSGGYMLRIQLHTMEFADKNVYMFLDLLVYYILKNGKFAVDVSLGSKDCIRLSIGFDNTATFNLFIQNNFPVNYTKRKEAFIRFYEKGLQASRTWFRRLLTREILSLNITISKVTSDVSAFLKNISIKEETIDGINDAVSEFVSNTEHNDGDCLLYIY